MYQSPRNLAEYEAREAALDSLESQVLAVFGCYGLTFRGDGIDSRYGYLAANSGDWGVKIRIADHANQTRNADFNEADVQFIVGREYTPDQIWRRVLDAIHRAAS